MKCPYCGKESSESFKFCDGCGAKLISDTPVVEQPVYYQEPKKSKAGLIVAIVIISILLITGIVVGIILMNNGGDKKSSSGSVEPNKEEKDKDPPKQNNEFNLNDISYTDTVLSDGDVILELKNNGSSTVSFSVDIEYYDSNNVEVDDNSDYVYFLHPGKETIVEFYHTRKEYSTYKIKIKEYKNNIIVDRSDDVSFTSRDDKENEEIVVTLTNSSTKEIQYAEMIVSYYKNNKIVGYDYDSIDDFDGSKSIAKSAYYPYDDNFDTIDFDNYKVFIVAYDVNFDY